MPSRPRTEERIFPCLLDRLTDAYPRARKEGRQHRVVTLRQYRDSVLRHLAWLLNTSAHPPATEFEGLADAKNSVMNYGVRNLSGVWVSNRSAADIERQVREAILAFEPRILPGSLQVSMVAGDGGVHENSQACLEISGELWAEPVPENLYLRTTLDLETGECQVIGR